MTDELKIAFEEMSKSTFSETPRILKAWLDVTPNEAMDVKAQVSTLVMDAVMVNEGARSRPRMIIRRPFAGLSKLASSAPWNELLVIGPAGEVKLNESLTKEEVAEMWRIMAPYQSAIVD